ncbi:MAG TPA: cytochrome D1 domain-containing protein [Steroidobacteraceae bacterium]|nr:cytochrome D1 domain-containing protein [Steroidobacteraceae bacterium]
MPQKKAALLIGAALAWALAIGGYALAAEATPANALLATSKGDHTLAIVDPLSDAVVAKMPIGPDPHEVIADADGRTAYVSNMGNSSFHRIDVLDLIGQRALAPIDTGPLTGVHGLAISSGKLWFTAQGAMAIARLDLASRQVDWIMGTGQSWTHMLVLTPDLKRIYATNVMSGSLSIFALEQARNLPFAPRSRAPRPPAGVRPPLVWVHTLVATERGAEGVDLSPDGKEVWTASSASGRVYVIDTAARKLAHVLDAKAIGANRVKFTHDGRRVLISSLRTGDVLIYDAKARTEIKRMHVGRGCAGVLVAPDDRRAYVACTSDNYVAVLDMGTMALVDRIDVGPQPDGLAWASRH